MVTTQVDRLKVDRLKVEGERLLGTSAFSLRPKYLESNIR